MLVSLVRVKHLGEARYLQARTYFQAGKRKSQITVNAGEMVSLILNVM